MLKTITYGFVIGATLVTTAYGALVCTCNYSNTGNNDTSTQTLVCPSSSPSPSPGCSASVSGGGGSSSATITCGSATSNITTNGMSDSGNWQVTGCSAAQQ